MCRTCVAKGEMTQAELDEANSTDSDAADFSGLSAVLAPDFSAVLAPDFFRALGVNEDPQEQARQDTQEVLDSMIGGVESRMVKSISVADEDPNSYAGLLERYHWVAGSLRMTMEDRTIAFGAVVTSMEASRLRRRVEELEALVKQLTMDNADLQRRIERLREAGLRSSTSD